MQLVLDAPVARAHTSHTCKPTRLGRVMSAPLCAAQRSLRAPQRRQPSTSSSAPVARLVTSAAAQAEASSSQQTQPEGWFALVANAEFMLHDVQNESFAEQLREKARYYREQGKDIDFFLVSEPAWLDAKFPNEAKKVGRPCVALVTPDRLWAKFMKLRLDRVMFLELGDMAEAEVLDSTAPPPEFKGFDKWIAPYAPYAPGWWNAFMKDGKKQ